jgi:hypothetical protein
MLEFLVSSFAVAAISLTITRSSITTPIREYLRTKKTLFLYRLFACPYCMAHYIALLCALLVDLPLTLSQVPIVHLGLLTMALVGSSAVIIGIVTRYIMTSQTQIEILQEKLIQAETELWQKA